MIPLNPFSSKSRFNAPRLIKIGLSLFVWATIFAFFVMLGGLSGGHVSVILFDAAVLLPLLMALVGFVLIFLGALGWALHSSVQKLTGFGIALLGFSVVCCVMIDKIDFGFDNPGILLALTPAALFLLLGILFLLTAGIRQFRAGSRRTRVTPE